MTVSSDKTVIDYLDTLFFDVNLPPVQDTFNIKPCDSVELGCRLLPCRDPFSGMTMMQSSSAELWESFLLLLLLGQHLPQGKLRTYVFRQSQVLYQKTHTKTL